MLTVVCILLSRKPLFAAWSAFSLPGIPVWAGIHLIVGLCVNFHAASLMALVIVFKAGFLLFSVFTAVKESVCTVILSCASGYSQNKTHPLILGELQPRCLYSSKYLR